MTHFALRTALMASAALAFAAPAFAQDTAPPPPITITGSASIISDYRFRGVSQSDNEFAVQGGFTVAHESGLYVGTWGSNLAGWGAFGGANMELDVIGGFKKTFGSATVDVGLVWYMYPGGFDNTDFAEPYVKLSGTTGPVTLTAGVAFAPKQEALGRWYRTGADAAAGVYTNPGAKSHNLYLSGDGAMAIPNTPFTAKAHIGFSDGNKGLGPNATSVAPTGQYWDYSVGVDTTYKNLTLGIAYVDTDIKTGGRGYNRLQPSFSRGQDGVGSISSGTFVVALTAAF
jgi:uncharacterized protein (TIGR02001 family)